ncbi:trafficking kinesin-binding protein 2-like isoform X2 [Lampris incognitus]|nr:trafficking kinesin-binding protein 2-like isoform X2 [Lampris incognitus]XP_056157663.1 trafficking kinesin-binding protein 2-like isoform X2 [Lampris incognitus]
MTRTHNDIDVVTHLLAERDRDLELAARIGQSLLQRNNLLQERNEAIEEQLAQALDQVHQLQHELSKKDELLRIVASASEECETDSSCSTPYGQPQSMGTATAAAALSQLEALQSKLQEVEEENLALRSEARHLKRETITYEEKEQQLVSDCVKELRESNSQMVSLTDELAQKNEELLRHQEEIAQLLSQIVELQHRVKELALEKEELRIHLQASKDAQRELTVELNELTERNAECVGMLHESQEEIKELRSKNTPSAGMHRHLSYGLYPMDSLAAEIEGTMRRELSVEEEKTFQDQRTFQKKVFHTVRAVNASATRASSATPPIPGSGHSSLVMTAQPFQSAQEEEVQLGQPGSPGRNDLSRALHRLSLRRQNVLCERQFFRAERERQTQTSAGVEAEGVSSHYSSPAESAHSSFSNLSELSISSSVFKTFLPEKLQIVKPMEGSLTLHHWQQLAKPHLGTILDPHPGVVTKGFRPLPQDAIYRLTDLEEDEEDEEHRGRMDRALGKGAAGEDMEEEDEGGITFKVYCSSTPEEKNQRKPVGSPFLLPPLSPNLWTQPVVITSSAISDLSFTSGPCHVSKTPSLSVQPTPVASPAPSQPESQNSFSTASSLLSSSVQIPGKCQSSTFSTYTFTTCRILHPSDITQVISSSYSQYPLLTNTPSSMRSGPSTPVTPCRLSLGDSFPPRRSTLPPSGLAKLVLEKGISAQVSTDKLPTPPKLAARQPLCHLLPSTPPNSPSRSHAPSLVPIESGSVPADNFLASRPTELFLQDVYGLNLGRAPRPDLPSPSQKNTALDSSPTEKSAQSQHDTVSVGLVERLCRLGFATVLQSGESKAPPLRQDSSTLVAASGGSLLGGLRRNQSLPAMIGAWADVSSANPSQTIFPPNHPPPHPTSLALPLAPWGDRKE